MLTNYCHQSQPSVRLDKWLWAARFCKTRSLAKSLVESGKVKYNQQSVKPSKIVDIGAELVIPCGFDKKTVRVLGVSEQRLSASLAQQLYSETPESIALRAANAEARRLKSFHNPHPEARPDKKQRRQIIRFKQQ